MFAAQPLAWLSPIITILRVFLRFMLHFLPLFLLNFLVVVSGLCEDENLKIEGYYFSCVHSIRTYGLIYYVHMRELGQYFYFLCFVGLTIRCTSLYNYFIYITLAL